MESDYLADSETDVAADESIDELVNRQRVSQIYKRRESVYAILQQAPARQLEDRNLSDEKVRYLFEKALEGLVLDLQQLMIAAADTDKTEHNFWDGDQFHVATTLNPPPQVPHDAERYRNPMDPAGEWSPAPEGVVLQGYGASALFAVERPVTLTWAWEETQRHGGRTEDSVTQQYPLPEEYLRSIFQVCNSFLQAIDLDVRIGGGEIAEHGEPY